MYLVRKYEIYLYELQKQVEKREILWPVSQRM